METTDKPISVFLVDDDKMFLSSLAHSLSKKLKSKIKINSFSTGELALKKMSDNPNIIILDYYLNSENKEAMDGLQVLKKIKLEENEAFVIMLSAQDKLEVVADSFKNGAFEYVVKNESFFVRIENLVRNIISSIEIERESNKYSKWNYIIGIILIILILFDLIYYNMR